MGISTIFFFQTNASKTEGRKREGGREGGAREGERERQEMEGKKLGKRKETGQVYLLALKCHFLQPALCAERGAYLLSKWSKL